jgi:hypothetical protein
MRKLIFFLFLICVFFNLISYSQIFSFPTPHDTQLIEETQTTDDIGLTRFYYYRSKLGKDQIINFYDRILSHQGFEFYLPNESEGEIIDDMFVYKKNDNLTITIMFGSVLEGDTLYYVYETTKKDGED